MRPAPSPTADSAVGRFRFGWAFAPIWLVYLEGTLRALTGHPGGWRRDLGLVALALFAVGYLLAVTQGRRVRRTGEERSLAGRWAQVGVLVALVALMMPGAGQHAVRALIYVVAVAMMNLPIRQALAVGVLIFGAAQVSPRAVPGWRDEGDGLAVLLAGVAVWGIRQAFERNQRLVDAQAELGALAVERERARIATDLHDILGHSLTVVTVKAELAQRLLDTDPERARTELRDLERLCRDALADVRSTTRGVRGVSLATELAAAREALAAANVQARLPSAADEIASPWRELFAWTIREAVTNLVRHSGATTCEIRLTPASVEVLDNGTGAHRGAAGGQGLTGLRRRAEELGARLSAADRTDAPGFRVLVEAPV
jgi:two-component system sensor histidine kinase DesK